MAQHVLSLEAPDTLNPALLRLIDTSIYIDMLTLTCPIL